MKRGWRAEDGGWRMGTAGFNSEFAIPLMFVLNKFLKNEPNFRDTEVAELLWVDAFSADASNLVRTINLINAVGDLTVRVIAIPRSPTQAGTRSVTGRIRAGNDFQTKIRVGM